MNITNQKRLKVLLIAEQCNPDWPSVPLVAWNYFKEISRQADVHLVTHDRNRTAIQKALPTAQVTYIAESRWTKLYYQIVVNTVSWLLRGRSNWPIYHVLTYPIYAEFNHQVFQQFQQPIQSGEYDIVHAMTPMMPRYPVKAIRACQQTPFLLGPVNGGIPFPKGFRDKAWQEFSYLNFLRVLGRMLIPGYAETYQKADRILTGSTYTRDLLQQLFGLPDDRVQLFHENGIPKTFLGKSHQPQSDRPVNLIFVGRLVPYKCADVVIEAVGQIEPSLRQNLRLTIVGDGSERGKLEALAAELNLSEIVQFAGWVDHDQTLKYYQESDIFCFPSIREFGGAVVLEAMASGLPCIVADHGGIGEYVTDSTGYKIAPRSRQYLVQEMATHIRVLATDPSLRAEMSTQAIARAQEFEWEAKAKKIVETYGELIARSQRVDSVQPHLMAVPEASPQPEVVKPQSDVA